MTSHQKSFKKDYEALKHILRGAECWHALHALEFAEEYHSGFRKNGKTPNFHHQVKIAFTLYDERDRIKAAGLNLDEVIAEGILHDTYEDNQSLQLYLLEKHFNARIAKIVTVLSKVRSDKKIPLKEYYEEILQYPEAVIVKLHDRRNNVETIADLPAERQVAYVPETHQLLLFTRRAVGMYPRLEGLIQHSRKQIKSYLDLYLASAQLFSSKRGREVMGHLKAQNLLTDASALRPSSGRGRPRQPKAPQA